MLFFGDRCTVQLRPTLAWGTTGNSTQAGCHAPLPGTEALAWRGISTEQPGIASLQATSKHQTSPGAASLPRRPSLTCCIIAAAAALRVRAALMIARISSSPCRGGSHCSSSPAPCRAMGVTGAAAGQTRVRRPVPTAATANPALWQNAAAAGSAAAAASAAAWQQHVRRQQQHPATLSARRRGLTHLALAGQVDLEPGVLPDLFERDSLRLRCKRWQGERQA